MGQDAACRGVKKRHNRARWRRKPQGLLDAGRKRLRFDQERKYTLEVRDQAGRAFITDLLAAACLVDDGRLDLKSAL